MLRDRAYRRANELRRAGRPCMRSDMVGMGDY
jgi:hypothetical protein